MFSVVYKFEVKPGRRCSFEKSRKDITQLFYEYVGSLGSRLHQIDEFNYVAYAQWPNKETWEHSSNKLPQTSKEINKLMIESCRSIETQYELELIVDLLKDKPKSKK